MYMNNYMCMHTHVMVSLYSMKYSVYNLCRVPKCSSNMRVYDDKVNLIKRYVKVNTTAMDISNKRTGNDYSE